MRLHAESITKSSAGSKAQSLSGVRARGRYSSRADPLKHSRYADSRAGSFGSPNTAEEIANLIDIKDEQIAAVSLEKRLLRRNRSALTKAVQ